MYLSSVDISNFRSFETFHADFQQGLNVVVGRNNTGKTNLLHAIRHALGPAASHGSAVWLTRDDFYRASANDEEDRTISITLTFSGLSESDRTSFFELVDFNLADISNSRAVLRFEASWPKDKRQASTKRTGGPLVIDQPDVPSSVLESLPITFLPALRDAEASLVPGYRSRLALLLRDIATRKGGSTVDDIKGIFASANEQLERTPVVGETVASLQDTTRKLAGSDYASSSITAAAVDFDKILRSLQVQMHGAPIETLDANGLGYNNILYISVILEHLKSSQAGENVLLLVEEPEAHLHPQLTFLLAEYLSRETPGPGEPQTIATTHSPTLAASVPPSRISVLFTSGSNTEIGCYNLMKAGMTTAEENALRRMVDITRATMYFAKGIILVEGITESLLFPVLAMRLGHDLAMNHISVVPICGVAFGIFEKVLGSNALGIPVAIVTDADPAINRGEDWTCDEPQVDGGSFALSDRTRSLLQAFSGNDTVEVFHSKLTLEFDLADAGTGNAALMAEVWEDCFVGRPGTLNRTRVQNAGEGTRDRALAVWRGICRADHTGSKAEFAHRLAYHLDPRKDDESSDIFLIPDYIRKAIAHVIDPLDPGEVDAPTEDTGTEGAATEP